MYNWKPPWEAPSISTPLTRWTFQREQSCESSAHCMTYLKVDSTGIYSSWTITKRLWGWFGWPLTRLCYRSTKTRNIVNGDLTSSRFIGPTNKGISVVRGTVVDKIKDQFPIIELTNTPMIFKVGQDIVEGWFDKDAPRGKDCQFESSYHPK